MMKSGTPPSEADTQTGPSRAPAAARGLRERRGRRASREHARPAPRPLRSRGRREAPAARADARPRGAGRGGHTRARGRAGGTGGGSGERAAWRTCGRLKLGSAGPGITAPPQQTRLGSPFGAVYSQLSRDDAIGAGTKTVGSAGPAGRACPAWGLRARSGRRAPSVPGQENGQRSRDLCGLGRDGRRRGVASLLGPSGSWRNGLLGRPSVGCAGLWGQELGERARARRRPRQAGSKGGRPRRNGPPPSICICHERLEQRSPPGPLGVLVQSQARATPLAPTLQTSTHLTDAAAETLRPENANPRPSDSHPGRRIPCSESCPLHS